MSKPSQILVVLVTCPPDQAEVLAATLVEARAAACVNIIPAMRSVYRWKGQVRKDGEALLLIKTSAGRFSALKELVLKHHLYELPEIIAVNVEQGHAPYLSWVLDSCT